MQTLTSPWRGTSRLAVLITAVLVAACSTPAAAPTTPTATAIDTVAPMATPTPSTHRLSGTVELYDGWIHEGLAFGPRCWGAERGGYSDFQAGAQVTVRDAAGLIIATGTLAGGGLTGPAGACVFPFTVRNVPETDFYTVQVANRDGPSFSLAELEASGWDVALSIGN